MADAANSTTALTIADLNTKVNHEPRVPDLRLAICETLGLAPQKQRERIQRDPILSEGATMTVFPSLNYTGDTMMGPPLVQGNFFPWLLIAESMTFTTSVAGPAGSG